MFSAGEVFADKNVRGFHSFSIGLAPRIDQSFYQSFCQVCLTVYQFADIVAEADS